MRNIRIDKLSESILDTISAVKDEVKSEKFNYYNYINISFLKRYVYILYGIHELLPKYKENKNLIITLSPLLRMGLCDFISQCYILSAIEPNSDFNNFKVEYEKRVEQVLFSPFAKEINSIEKQKQIGSITIDEYKEKIRNVYSFAKIAFSFFNEDSLEYELKIKNDISPAKMLRIFCENKKFKQYYASYQLYDYYSKMEHFGGLSNMINGIEYKNDKVNTDRLIHTTIIISKGIEFCVQNIESENSDIILKRLETIAFNYLIEPLRKQK